MNDPQTTLQSFLLLLFVLLLPAFAAGRLATAFETLDADHGHATAQAETAAFGGIPVAELHVKAQARRADVRPA